MRSQVADLTPATAQSVDVVLSHWLCGDGAWAVVEAARPAVVVLDEVHRAKSTSAARISASIARSRTALSTAPAY